MAGSDYMPLWLPGHELTCTAAAAITAGQLVYVSGNTGYVPSVTPTTAATTAKCGVAAQTVPSGASVDVYFNGVHLLAASGAITAGDPVVAAAAGAVADVGTPTATLDAEIVGNALTAAASGFVVVMLD